jgi:hypothetical protein
MRDSPGGCARQPWRQCGVLRFWGVVFVRRCETCWGGRLRLALSGSGARLVGEMIGLVGRGLLYLSHSVANACTRYTKLVDLHANDEREDVIILNTSASQR